MIPLAVLSLTCAGAAAFGQEGRPDPDRWLNAELRRELARPPPTLWRPSPEERDRRGDGAAMNDVLANDLISSLAEIVRDPAKALDFRVRTFSPVLPHPYEERFRHLREELERRGGN